LQTATSEKIPIGDAFQRLARTEDIILALGLAPAIAEVIKRAPRLAADKLTVVELSSRGAEDVSQVAAKVGMQPPAQGAGLQLLPGLGYSCRSRWKSTPQRRGAS
jgi:hypothetical protein